MTLSGEEISQPDIELCPLRERWQTPFKVLVEIGPFDLDPCASVGNRHAALSRDNTVKDDGLKQPWHGFVWLNPPYGAKAKDWLVKLARHGDGMALVPPKMGAGWFHDKVLGTADFIHFFRGRLAFVNPDNGKRVEGNTQDSCLIGWGGNARSAIAQAQFAGRTWFLR